MLSTVNFLNYTGIQNQLIMNVIDAIIVSILEQIFLAKGSEHLAF